MTDDHADGTKNTVPTTPQPGDGRRDQIREYWHILAQRRWVVFTCLAVVVATTTLLTLLAKSEYQATTTLQIERRAPEILTFKDVLDVDPSYAAYQDFYQTQYKILLSQAIKSLAIDKIDLVHHPSFLGRSSSPIKRFMGWTRNLFGPADKETADPRDEAFAYVEGGLTVYPIPNSQLVQVSFSDPDPALARDIANAVADGYLEFTYNSRYQTTAQATDFLTKQVAIVQGEIADLERKLQEYGVRKEILALSDGTQDISEKALADANSRYTEAEGRLALAQARMESLRNSPPEAIPEVLGSPLINTLKQKYAEVERQYSQMTQRFKPGWPALQQVEEEMQQARQRLTLETRSIADQVLQTAEADYMRAAAEVEYLGNLVDQQKTVVQRIHRDAIDYASIKAEIENKRKVVNDLITRQSETQVSNSLIDTSVSNVRVVDRATEPQTPIRPRKTLNLLFSLILGTGLGIGMAFLLHYIDNAVDDEHDIRRIAGIPCLGFIPLVHTLREVPGKNSQVVVHNTTADFDTLHDPRAATAEAFKNLRASLLLAFPDHPPRTVLITSPAPREGKSFVALNLAFVLSQLGRKILLVDGDMRRPRVHKALSLNNRIGLSSLLSGNVQPSDVIQKTPETNLMVIPSGPIPPNPSELLCSSSLHTFVTSVQQDALYDHIIFDSPPLLTVSDSILLADQLDSTIVIIRSGVTTRESLSLTMSRLRDARVSVIGAVLNALSEGHDHYNYHHYRYIDRHTNTEQDHIAHLVNKGT